MSERVLASRDSGVLRVTLNRPEKLNALTGDMLAALRGALDGAADDPQTRCVLLSGAGRAFCVGQDLSEQEVRPGSDLGAWIERYYNPVIRALRVLGKPVVARVNGVAAGAGANLAFACDLVVAGTSAQFIESFCRIGLLPDSGGTWMLPRLVGQARATAIAMLGTPIGARQAYEWGAIWKVADDAELDAECDALVRTLSASATRSLGAIKSAIAASWNADLEAQLARERDLQKALGESADFREGVEAFAQKREAHFTGN